MLIRAPILLVRALCQYVARSSIICASFEYFASLETESYWNDFWHILVRAPYVFVRALVYSCLKGGSGDLDTISGVAYFSSYNQTNIDLLQ